MSHPLIDEIITRRSCKSYLPDPVPEEIIEEVIRAGLYAASGLNRQTPVILAVTNKDVRNRLSALNAKYDPMKRPDPFYHAPVVLAVLVKREEPMGVYDGSLTLGNMMLAAHALGIGSCWIHRGKEVFDDPEGQEILRLAGIEGDYTGIGHLVLGYPEKQRTDLPPRREGRVFHLD